MTHTPTGRPVARFTSIDRHDPSLNSFIEFREDPDGPSRDIGDLDDLLFAVKDLIDVAGFVTTNGSPVHNETPADVDASLISRIRDRGGRIVGKTNLNEYAYGVSGFNPHFGPVINPKDRDRTAGGSSGGSAAAVAAGVVDVAVGTDTSGSIRIPAACCGIYGFKLGRGAAPMEGVTPFAPTFDSLGFFTADVEDLQRILQITTLPDPGSVRIGRLGHDLETPALPAAHWTILRKEAWDVHGEQFTSDPEKFGKDIRWKLRLPIEDVEDARQQLKVWDDRFVEATSEWDVLVGPVIDGLAPTIAAAQADYDRDEFLVGDRLLRHTPVYNELGWPALACPTASGPIQIAAPPGREASILSVAKSIGLRREDTVVPTA